MIHIGIFAEPFEPFTAVSEFQQKAEFNATACGANALFVGTMRDFNEGDHVTAMTLEHYPAMTLKQLEAIAERATATWGLNHVLILHRVGAILPAEAIVLVAVWSAHRKAAFEACREVMEWLKHEAPFWKRETLENGSERWVEKNTGG